MTTPQEKAEIDQSFALLTETMPPALYRFFKNLVSEGFNDTQALVLTKQFLSNIGVSRREDG